MAQQQVAAQLSAGLLKAAEIAEETVDQELKRLEELDEDDLERIRQKRLRELKERVKQKEKWEQAGHGDYQEVANEPEFFAATKKSANVVCHFFRESTERCKIVDTHLQQIAQKHVEARFIKANVDRVPFVVQRLNIRMLPTIAVIKDQNTVDYIRGFDDLGGVDDFKTEVLEWRLGQSKVIKYSGAAPPGVKSIDGAKTTVNVIKKKTIRQTAESDSD